MYYYTNAYDIWPLGHKITFNGETKQILINDDESLIDVKIDLYSNWKEWAMLRDNMKFPLAFRVIGGDPIDTIKGIYAGDTYFLMNGWQIVIPHSVKLTGVLYHDDPISPFIINKGGGVEATVSNLVQTVATSVPVVQFTMQELIAGIWDAARAAHTDPGSTGEQLNKLLTVAKYIGLK